MKHFEFHNHLRISHMDILKMLADLRAKQELIDQAILALERLAVGTHGKRRGRPPKWMAAARAESPAQIVLRKKWVVTEATRQRMAEAQKKRWAAKRVEAAQAALQSERNIGACFGHEASIEQPTQVASRLLV